MSNERRKSKRFPLHREARYTVLEPHKRHSTVGTETLDMSSHGLRIRCVEAPELGSRMDVSVSWPVPLENGCRLKLVARAKVVWRSVDEIGVTIERHEFRTQGKDFAPPAV